MITMRVGQGVPGSEIMRPGRTGAVCLERGEVCAEEERMCVGRGGERAEQEV
jgi:hypothetical protein